MDQSSDTREFKVNLIQQKEFKGEFTRIHNEGVVIIYKIITIVFERSLRVSLKGFIFVPSRGKSPETKILAPDPFTEVKRDWYSVLNDEILVFESTSCPPMYSTMFLYCARSMFVSVSPRFEIFAFKMFFFFSFLYFF